MRRLAAVVATLGLLLSAAAPAWAQSGPRPVVVGVSLSTDGGPTGVRLNVQNTFPGDLRSVAIFLDGEYVYAVDRIALDVDNLRDHENDCLRQEARAGDDCTSPVGELSRFLQISAEAGTQGVTADGQRSCTPNAAGTGTPGIRLDHLAAGSDQLVMARPSGDTTVVCGIVRLWFEPRADANIAMTDSSVFDLHTVFEWDPELLPAEFWIVDPPGGGGDPGDGGPGDGGPGDGDGDGGEPPTGDGGGSGTVPTLPSPDPDGIDPTEPVGPPAGPGDGDNGAGPGNGNGNGPEVSNELIVDERADDPAAGAAAGRRPGGSLAFTGGTLTLLTILGALSLVAGGLILFSRRPGAPARVASR